MVDVWKEYILEDLKGDLLEYELVREFLADIRKEFGGGNKEIMKIVELKRLEQEENMMEEFVQEFRRAAKSSRYERRLLVKEFKREMNMIICCRLMEAK